MKNRILFLLHVPPPVHGSAVVGKYIKDSDVLNKLFRCRFVDLGTSRRVDHIGEKNLYKIFLFLRIILNTLYELVFYRPNVCYMAITAKGQGFYKDFIIVSIIKIFRVDIIYHFHNKGVSSKQNRIFDKKLYSIAFKNAHAIILSKYLSYDIEHFFPDERVFICPNGLPDPLSDDNICLRENVTVNNKVKILFLSNLIETKGVYVLLEACKLLSERNLDFLCYFVGGEGDISSIKLKEKIDALELSEFVYYLGKRYGKDKVEVFSEADIFTFPTFYHNETFGLVNVEAMCFSLPIISTFEGGIPDVVDDNLTGFLIPQKNSSALAEKIEILIKYPELRKKMGAAGRKKYEESFSLEVFERKLAEILLKILEEK